MTDHKKLLIIGLDGATWDVLIPLIEGGKLPILGKLVKNGAYGTLKSTIPPVTGGAWLSIATGKSPGKTGIIDFLNRKDLSYRLCPVSSADFKGQSFWDYLGKINKKVGIFNYPMLFPPYGVNGFMVSGVGASPADEITYPPSLKNELENVESPYEVSIYFHSKRYENPDLFIRDLNEFLDKFEKWVYYVVKEKEWDVLFLVISVTDWVQHILWRHIDEDHPWHDPKTSPKYKREFIKFWQRIDEILGKVLELSCENTAVFMVSDHGFGSNDQTFNLAKWLVKKGYMIQKRSIKRLVKKYMYKIVNKTAVIMAKTPVFGLMEKVFLKSAENVLGTNLMDEIDFEKSKAYCLGHTIPFGAIYINAKNEKEKKKIKSKLIHDLKNLSKDIGKEVEVQIYEPKKLYSGEKSDLLPDIIFTINDWRCVVIEDRFDRPLFEEKPFSTRHTGTHRLNGIFLAYGPGIKKGYKITDAKIYDIAPTVLHIFGLPIPNDMDGRVLMEIFEEDSEFAKRKPKYVVPSYYHTNVEDEKEKLKTKIKYLKMKGKI